MSADPFTPNPNQQQILDWLKQQRAANVTASPERFAQFKSEFLQRLDKLSLTVPNQAPDATTLFYSGKVDDRDAWRVAEALGKASNGKTITIGQTELGRLANDEVIFRDVLDKVIDPKDHPAQSAEITQAIWDRASHRLAGEARGAVHTLTPNARGDRVYASVELPQLLRNDKVTQIDGLDRTELAALRDRLQTQHGYTPERAMEVVKSRISVQSAIDLERTHGIRPVLHPELKQATETLRAAAVDLQGSAQGKALTQAVQHLEDLNLHPPAVAPAADPARPAPTPMDPDRMARIRVAAKAAGIAGTAYGVYQGVGETQGAIDTARSNREQWVRGAEAGADVATRGAVTGIAGAGGGALGAAGGTLTSPVTGPVGPIAGAVVVGGAATMGADKLYEDSRLQQFSKMLGRAAGQLGYDHVSREGRLLREVNGLKENLQTATDPAERARLQSRLDTASERFATEAERNGRYFEGRASIDKAWEQAQAKYPKVDKDDINDALARHIDAGKRPDEAARAAMSDAVHEKYPRALPHYPLEDYRALSNEQLAEKHRHYVAEIARDRQQVQQLAAIKDSRNTLDQGYPRELAEQRHSQRIQEGLNAFWKDTGHLASIREAYKARGMSPPELPDELRKQGTAQRSPAPDAPAQHAPAATTSPAVSPRDAFRQQENADRSRETASGPSSAALSTDQQRHLQLAREQLGPALSARGKTPEQIERICAAAVCHAQEHAERGPVRAFHLGKDGERVAIVQAHAPMSEMSVSAAQQHSSEQHLARAQSVAQAQQHPSQSPSQSQASTQTPSVVAEEGRTR